MDNPPKTRAHIGAAGAALLALLLVGVAASRMPPLAPIQRTLARDLPILTTTIFNTPTATNGVISPLGLRELQLACYLGASGLTAQQLKAQLDIRTDGPALLSDWRDAKAQCLGDLASPDAVWTHAATIWSPPTAPPFRNSYLNLLRGGLHVRATPLPAHPEDATLALMGWFIDHNTPPASLPPSPKGLLVTQADTFVAPWQEAFDWRITRQDTFQINGTTNLTSVATMYAHRPLPYAEDTHLKMTALTYAGGSHYMVLILPRIPLAPSGVAALATPERIQALLEAATPHRVELSLPIFSVSLQASLRPALAVTGSSRLLDPARAQLDAMTHSTTNTPTHISDLHQSTRFSIVEAGIEDFRKKPSRWERIGCAAAPLPEATFLARHPFLFLVIHPESHATPFAGWVANPAQ